MADAAIDKLRDQYVEVILHAMPISQMFFLMVMAIVFNGLLDGSENSVMGVVSGISIKKSFNFDEGVIWLVPLKCILGAFFISILNTFFINRMLKRSFSVSDIAARLPSWHYNATRALDGLSIEQRLPIQVSLREELGRRIKKFNTKRLLYEIIFSIAVCVISGSLFLLYLNFDNLSLVEFSFSDSLFCIFCLIVSFLLNRDSINYAISKVVSIQVALSAATGELIFIDGVA